MRVVSLGSNQPTLPWARGKAVMDSTTDRMHWRPTSQIMRKNRMKAEIHALRALIGLRCDAVCYVGEDMRVVDSDPKLEELLGPMKNRCVEEKIVANCAEGCDIEGHHFRHLGSLKEVVKEK